MKIKKIGSAGFTHHLALMFAVVIVGIGGSLYLVLTHADTQANCVTPKSPAGAGSATLCVSMVNATQLTGSLVYSGVTTSDTLTSGTITVSTCTQTTTPTCAVAVTNSNLLKYSLQTTKKTNMYTAGVTYAPTTAYKACVTFVSTSGWHQSTLCTNVVGFSSGGTVTIYGQPIAGTYVRQAATPLTSDCKSEPVPVKPDGTQWQCSFDEEFNGTSLDTTKWTPQLTAVGGFRTGPSAGLIACYVNSPNNISVSDGSLNLTVRKEAAPFTCNGLPAGYTTTQYTGGTVTSINKFSQTYGRYEVRAKLPNTTIKGLQETLWLWPQNLADSVTKYGRWPGSGELDFSEFYSRYANYDVPAFHYNLDPATPTNYGTGSNVSLRLPNSAEPETDCTFNYSTYNDFTFVWNPNKLEVYINNNLCTIDYYKSASGDATPFNQPFFIALTQALGTYGGSSYGDNSFDPAITPLPATTQIDYVRVWK